ncbi:MAG: hypothetical protein HFJ29_03995 [Clostridia bacterium]|nr:hypothetical protein [Clostridia bacterium]
MSLRIVYGTAGTGKSTYLFQEIQQNLKQKKQANIKVITPEQFSFTLEKKLLDFAPASSVLSAEVITFNRMAYRILEEVGGKTKKHLTKSGRVMLLDEILLSQKNDFTFLGKTDENIEMIGTQITELKKHQVSVETLKEITKSTQDVYLQKKLQDIYKIYEAYATRIQDQYIDENDNLTILAELLEQSTQFQNCDIYLDEFVGFTTQEYHILRKLMKISKSITITICADNLEENTNPDHDIFYSNKQTASRLIKMAEDEDIIIEEPINLNSIIGDAKEQQRVVQRTKI